MASNIARLKDVMTRPLVPAHIVAVEAEGEDNVAGPKLKIRPTDLLAAPDGSSGLSE